MQMKPKAGEDNWQKKWWNQLHRRRWVAHHSCTRTRMVHGLIVMGLTKQSLDVSIHTTLCRGNKIRYDFTGG